VVVAGVTPPVGYADIPLKEGDYYCVHMVKGELPPSSREVVRSTGGSIYVVKKEEII